MVAGCVALCLPVVRDERDDGDDDGGDEEKLEMEIRSLATRFAGEMEREEEIRTEKRGRELQLLEMKEQDAYQWV